jgi:predicted esterase
MANADGPAAVRRPAATTHGRYLVKSPAPSNIRLALVGFHGYAETAETQLERLLAMPGAEHAVLISVQGLHRFYRGRMNEVVASWMTRQDRELALEDNLAYVNAVVDAVLTETSRSHPLVFAGFSQGVAMAFRAACGTPHRAAAVIAVGGDIPPELDAPELQRVGAVLIGHGDRDDWYTTTKLESDVRRLEEAGVRVEVAELTGGHDWPPDFSRRAGEFLTTCLGV